MNFDHFQTHLAQVFEQVRNGNQPVLVERNGETYRLEKEVPEDIWKDYNPEKVQKALAASRGMLKGVDLDELLRDLDAQREQGPGRFE